MELVGKRKIKIPTREIKEDAVAFCACVSVALLPRLLFRGPQEMSPSLPDREAAAYLYPPFSQLLGLPLCSLSLFIFLGLPFFVLSYLSAHPPLVCSIYFWKLQQEKDGDRLEKDWRQRGKQIKGRVGLIYEERLKALHLHIWSQQHKRRTQMHRHLDDGNRKVAVTLGNPLSRGITRSN